MKRLPEHAVFWLLLLLLGLGSAGSLYKKAADQAALKAALPERILGSSRHERTVCGLPRSRAFPYGRKL